ncbi:oligopeptide ABC transporter substrate-binding protein [Bacillus testis]|uniref:oligopeptide ABC transporter substrate-binding protein n=1 Tax=Bacillus testis TaxID=1622072 RepID=UPI00067F5CF6|nr:oligopeptide ABC transporter substrate-binding protein [Bacillus testis]
MKKSKWSILSLLMIVMLVLGACSGNSTKTGKKGNEEKVDAAAFPLKSDNKDKGIKGGTATVGIIASAPFKGIWSWELYEDSVDADILSFANNTLFDTDKDFKFTDTGIGSMEVKPEENKAIVKIKKDVKWSDGQPLTIEDVIFPYEIIAHKDYTGVRYDQDLKNIIGAEEYHAGKADTISGLKKIDDHTLEISFKKVSPAIYTGGDGIWGYAAPKHDLKDVPVKDLLKSEKVRKTPVTLGPFKFDKIVPGESVQFVANENYWKGKPKLDKLVVKIVPPASAVAALKSGDIDFAASVPTDVYKSLKALSNTEILGRSELYYSYLGFNLGKWDAAKGENVMDPNAKMNDVKLRQALGYAMNIEEVNKQYYDGLRTRANAIIPPAFATYHDKELKGYTYDPEKAKKLLDEAGYKDVNKDGFREDKDGKPFEIKLAARDNSEVAEPITQFYIQNFKDVGLKVTLTNGRLLDGNSFYDKVEANDKDIDMYMAAWGTGTNPSPAGVYSKDAQFNMMRYVDPELTTLLEAIDSPEAMDASVRAKAFKKWEEYMFEKAPVIPMDFRYELTVVNKRLKNVDIDYATTDILGAKWEITKEQPVKGE